MKELSIGLLGSGEFEPWADPVDRWLLSRSRIKGPVLIFPTASAPEGAEAFDRWGRMGIEHYGRLGVSAEVVPLKTRDDALRPQILERLANASMVFFSGGNPAYLTFVLVDTPFYSALVDALARGLPYGGCSAGVACLGELAPDTSIPDLTERNPFRRGLGLFEKVYLGPHWNALDTFAPGARERFIDAVPADSRLLAIDERTAVFGDGTEWSVLGSGGVHLLQEGRWSSYYAHRSFTAQLLSPGTALAG